MNTVCVAVLVIGLQISTPTERLIAARTQAYDANGCRHSIWPCRRRNSNARDAAATALKLRPDFWYVNDQVLPRLTK